MSENNNSGAEQRDMLITLTTLTANFKTIEKKLDAMASDQKAFEQRLEDKFVVKAAHETLNDKVDALTKKLNEEYVPRHVLDPIIEAYNWSRVKVRNWVLGSILVMGVIGAGLYLGSQVIGGVKDVLSAQQQIIKEIKATK